MLHLKHNLDKNCKVKGHLSANFENAKHIMLMLNLRRYPTIQNYHKTACEWLRSKFKQGIVILIV